MKNIIYTLLILLSFITNANAQSMEKVPPIIAAPMVLFDDAGNILQDGEYELTLHVKDRFDNVVYQEEHIARVSESVSYLTIGSGYAVGSNYDAPAGGMDFEMFITDGDLKVEILVNGHDSPQLVNSFGSQPYSFVSNYSLGVANNVITSNKIKNGGIKAEDLDPQLLQSIVNPDGDVDGPQVMINPVTEIDATGVKLSDQIGLNNSGGNNLQDALRGMDKAIDNLRDIHIKQGLGNLGELSEEIQNTLNQEIDNRTQEVNNLTQNINNLSQGVDGIEGQILNERNARIAGDNNINNTVNNLSRDLTSEVRNRTNSVNNVIEMIENLDIDIDQLPDGVVLSDNPDPNVTDLQDILNSIEELRRLYLDTRQDVGFALEVAPIAHGEFDHNVIHNFSGFSNIEGDKVSGINPRVEFILGNQPNFDNKTRTMRIYFSERQPDTNYSVILTPRQLQTNGAGHPALINLLSKNREWFEVRCYEKITRGVGDNQRYEFFPHWGKFAFQVFRND